MRIETCNIRILAKHTGLHAARYEYVAYFIGHGDRCAELESGTLRICTRVPKALCVQQIVDGVHIYSKTITIIEGYAPLLRGLFTTCRARLHAVDCSPSSSFLLASGRGFSRGIFYFVASLASGNRTMYRMRLHSHHVLHLLNARHPQDRANIKQRGITALEKCDLTNERNTFQ